jgi:hypothetical protein
VLAGTSIRWSVALLHPGLFVSALNAALFHDAAVFSANTDLTSNARDDSDAGVIPARAPTDSSAALLQATIKAAAVERLRRRAALCAVILLDSLAICIEAIVLSQSGALLGTRIVTLIAIICASLSCAMSIIAAVYATVVLGLLVQARKILSLRPGQSLETDQGTELTSARSLLAALGVPLLDTASIMGGQEGAAAAHIQRMAGCSASEEDVVAHPGSSVGGGPVQARAPDAAITGTGVKAAVISHPGSPPSAACLSSPAQQSGPRLHLQRF